MDGSGCSSIYNQMKPQTMDQNIPNGNLKQQNYQIYTRASIELKKLIDL